MTLNQLETLTEDELGLALYVVNVLAPPGSPKTEFGPKNLTWFRRGVLEKKLLDIFPKLKPEGHATYSSLLTKLGIQHEIKYEQPPAPVVVPEISSVVPPLSPDPVASTIDAPKTGSV